MSGDVDFGRHRFVGTAVMSIAAARLVMPGSAVQSSTTMPSGGTTFTLPTVSAGRDLSQDALKAFADAAIDVDQH